MSGGGNGGGEIHEVLIQESVAPVWVIPEELTVEDFLMAYQGVVGGAVDIAYPLLLVAGSATTRMYSISNLPTSSGMVAEVVAVLLAEQRATGEAIDFVVWHMEAFALETFGPEPFGVSGDASAHGPLDDVAVVLKVNASGGDEMLMARFTRRPGEVVWGETVKMGLPINSALYDAICASVR